MNYVIANWKMNPVGVEKSKELFNSYKESDNVIVCAPYLYLPSLSEIDSEIKLGAQDSFWEESGAFTGEVSWSMLEEFCNYVIIGHSERRKLFEDEKMIAQKMQFVSESELTPILCVGETEEERKQGKTEEVLRDQIQKALSEVSEGSLIVGYEPRWAIGNDNPCSPQEAGPSALVTRNQLKKEGFDEVPVVYGGSVNSDNAASYLEFFDGWLIGSASLEPEEINKIIEVA
ncbi:MAG: triose-phosphate isomerase family protein [Candidatus Paceibacterota bacterium]